MLKQNLLLSALLLSSSSAFSQGKAPISQTPDDRVNYPSNYQVDDGTNLFFIGEYLYWLASEDGLYYAQSGLINSGNVSFDGKLERVHPEWESGFRIGAGFTFPKEGYDVIAYWTRLETDADSSAKGSLLPLWAQPDFPTITAASSASGKWNLSLNVADLEWGRSSWFGGHFSLRPFFGLRGTWIDQSLHNRTFYATTPTIMGNQHAKSNFHGAGLRAGADSRFELPHGFLVYGLASGSLLYGQFNGHLHIKEDQFTIAQSRDHFWKGVSSLQLALGTGWETHFAKDHLHIELHLGWEQNLWFSVNQMNHFLNHLSTGAFFKESSTLSTQGIVAGARLNF
jgi:hypothetical protein